MTHTAHLVADLDGGRRPDTATVIAAALEYNSGRLERGEIDRGTWETEQARLWALAVMASCAADVIRLVCPSLTIAPDPIIAPDRFRDVTPDMTDQRCICGVRISRHFDGWDGNRLSCDEARHRHGLA